MYQASLRVNPEEQAPLVQGKKRYNKGMPISSDPEKRARQLAAKKDYGNRKDGWRSSKAMRFYMPDEYAEELERLSKSQRDQLMIQALKENYIINPER